MHATEVVKSHPYTNRCPVILPFLAERIRQTGEPARSHPHAQILALHNRGTDSFGVGSAHDWDHLHRGYAGA